MKILVSFAGGTDPVAANAYDGPMLHIVRYYQPDKVLLILTEEMAVLARKDDRYRHSINWLSQKMGFKCHVEPLETGIESAHNFDAFREIVYSIFKKLKKDYPDAEILCNISSGTPQITATLCLAAVSFRGIRPVQVYTPVGAMNAGTKHLKQFDDDVLENNFDQLDQVNRCLEPQIVLFRKAMVTSRLRELISNYDYASARRLIEAEQDLGWPKMLFAAVAHGAERVNLRDREARGYARAMKEFEAYPVVYNRASTVLEYYLSARVKQRRGEIADFILRLSPMLQYLLEEYVMAVPNFRLADIVQKQRAVYYIQPLLVKEKHPGLYKWLNQKYGNGGQGFRSVPINSDFLLNVSLYFAEQGLIRERKELLDGLIKLRDVEREVRNELAHEMTSVSETRIKQVSGMNSRQIASSIEKIISRLYTSHIRPGAFALYDRLNTYILDMLEDA